MRAWARARIASSAFWIDDDMYAAKMRSSSLSRGVYEPPERRFASCSTPQIDSPTTIGTPTSERTVAGVGRQPEQRVVRRPGGRSAAGPPGRIDAPREAAVAGDAAADDALHARAERRDVGQARRRRARQLRARIVQQDAARLGRHEVVGALEDLAQRGVEAHVPVLGVLVAAHAHEEARDLLGRQREDRPGRHDRRRDRQLFGAPLRRGAGASAGGRDRAIWTGN